MLGSLAFKDKVDFQTDIVNIPPTSINIATVLEDPSSPNEGYAWFLKEKSRDQGEFLYNWGGFPIIQNEIEYNVLFSSKINNEIYRVKMEQNLA